MRTSRSLVRCTSLAAVALVLGLAAGPAAAQYPTRPVELVVPYAPGGGTDIMYRQIVKVIAEQRLKLLSSVATMRELGFNVISTQWRAVGAGGNLPKPIVDFWVGVLHKVRKTDEWRKGYLEKDVRRYAPRPPAVLHLQHTQGSRAGGSLRLIRHAGASPSPGAFL